MDWLVYIFVGIAGFGFVAAFLAVCMAYSDGVLPPGAPREGVDYTD